MNKNADILIVDDTPDNIRFLSSLLVEQGYNVRKALNGKMALTAVKAVLPDLILLDINMPGMNGYEVCEHLKQDVNTCSVPVIFLSALDGVVDKVKAFKIGGVDYITKPFHLEEILARIKNQLKIQALQTQLQVQNTQLEQTLVELKNTQIQLVHKEKMIGLGVLAAGMAHEINNPISFISGNLTHARQYIKYLLKLISLYKEAYPIPTENIQEAIEEIDLEFIVPDLQRLLDSMQNGTERIRTTILALRIFSRLDESDIKAVNIHEGIDSTLLLLEHRLKPDEKSPEINVVKEYGNLPLVTCYASQLNQVFFNLLNNAIDALNSKPEKDNTQSSISTIWISTELSDAETVKVKIKDNGVGIAEELESRLFDPFFTTKSVGKGSGLGLLTSYQIVDKHKGHITYNTSPGEGTEFMIEIPVKLLNIN